MQYLYAQSFEDNFAAHLSLRDEVEKAQISTINKRLTDLRSQILPLQVLADHQDIKSIDTLHDVVPLLFPVDFFKSYPEEFLQTGQFDKMTEWLSRLTSVDLSEFAKSNFQTMDDWMDFMDDQTGLAILHSSGTSGRLSFYPRGKAEVEARRGLFEMRLNDRLETEYRLGDRPNAVVWTAHAGGRTAFLRAVPLLVDTLAKTDELFFPLIPSVMSSDHHYYVMQCQNLMDQGINEAPEPSDYVRMRVEEAMRIHNDLPLLTERLLDVIAGLKYRMHVALIGAPARIHDLAQKGLARGMENMLMPGSYVGLGGGFKKSPKAKDLWSQLERFTGAGMINRDVYAMTELASSFETCTQGNFHIPPWVLVFLLDLKTGKPLPREGVQKGRAAFFDLVPTSHWGGVVTNDIIEVDWGECTCGRKTPYIKPDITRAPDGDMPMGWTSEAAMHDALMALREGLAEPQ